MRNIFRWRRGCTEELGFPGCFGHVLKFVEVVKAGHSYPMTVERVYSNVLVSLVMPFVETRFSKMLKTIPSIKRKYRVTQKSLEIWNDWQKYPGQLVEKIPNMDALEHHYVVTLAAVKIHWCSEIFWIKVTECWNIQFTMDQHAFTVEANFWSVSWTGLVNRYQLDMAKLSIVIDKANIVKLSSYWYRNRLIDSYQ